MSDQPRVILVADSASFNFGGEASLPLHYFIGLRRRGIEVWLVAHERSRSELVDLLGEDIDRVSFIPDRWINLMSCRIGRFLPSKVSYITIDWISRLSTQRAARNIARNLVRDHRATVVHQPTPVSPREPSLLYKMGAPVVMGPMNGNMTFPAAFHGSVKGQALLSLITKTARGFSGLLHWFAPGKLQAKILLVANDRTRNGLPKSARGEVRELVENGVDLNLWASGEPSFPPQGGERPPHFVFMGRLVDWKAVDVAVLALSKMKYPGATLEIIGDGPQRHALINLGEQIGVGERLQFSGWLSQADCAERLKNADVLLLPSIHECGGAVVLEALACARPVIATAWGGPLDYIDESCGILIRPDSREALVAGFAAAMDRLSADQLLRQSMGKAGHSRICRHYSWDCKVDKVLDIYRSAGSSFGSEP